MSDSLKVSEEPVEFTSLDGTELTRVVQSGGTGKTTLQRIANLCRIVANVFTKNQSVTPVDLTSGSSIAVNAALSNNFRLDLAHNGTLANPSNLTAGMVLNVRVKNTGTFTLAYASKWKFPGGAPTLTSGANSVDLISGVYDATDDAIYCGIAQDLS